VKNRGGLTKQTGKGAGGVPIVTERAQRGWRPARQKKSPQRRAAGSEGSRNKNLQEVANVKWKTTETKKKLGGG